MNPDQTAWEQSDHGPYCLQYSLPKNILCEMNSADEKVHTRL